MAEADDESQPRRPGVKLERRKLHLLLRHRASTASICWMRGHRALSAHVRSEFLTRRILGIPRQGNEGTNELGEGDEGTNELGEGDEGTNELGEGDEGTNELGEEGEVGEYDTRSGGIHHRP